MTGTRDGDLTSGALPPLDEPDAREDRPATAIPREVELKYLVRDLEALRSWLARDWGGALDGVEFGNERTVEVEDRYIDTAYGALEQAGFGARLRREDNGPYTVTVKSASHDRPGSVEEAEQLYSYVDMYCNAWGTTQIAFDQGLVDESIWAGVVKDIEVAMNRWPNMRQSVERWLNNYPAFRDFELFKTIDQR